MDNFDEKNKVILCNNLNQLLNSEEMRRKNDEQSEDSPQQKQPKLEEFEKLLENLKKVEEENNGLKAEIETTRAKERQLELKIAGLEKELDEFKKINIIQENCIENSESEILRLNECLKVTETILQETVEVSEEIISDLKSKVKTLNESVPKSPTELSPVEVKGRIVRRKKSKPSFYLELNRQKSVELNDKIKSGLKVLKHEMSDDLRHFVIQLIKELTQTMDSLEELAPVLINRLNKTLGKFWFCVIGENIWENSTIASPNNSYLKCELGDKYHLIVFRFESQSTENCEPIPNQESLPAPGYSGTNEPLIHIGKKSNNIEAQVEKFLVNIAMEALTRNSNDYHILSSYIRDAICNKFNSQWFVSVGQTQHYSTSWAMARSRKFMLFQIGDIKFTVGEVSGWLW